MNDVYISIPRRAIPIGGVVLAVLVLVALPATRELVTTRVGPLLNPTTVADQPALDAQRRGLEVAIARGYFKGADQLRQVRELKLPISTEEANRITDKAIADLRAVKRAALVSTGNALGLAPEEAQEYAKQREAALESPPDATEPAVLLAPRLFAIVSRANELLSQVADQATRDLTAARPTPAPSPSPSSIRR